MKRFFFLLVPLALFWSCQAAVPVAPPEAYSANAEASYAFGISVGANLAKTRIAFDWEAFNKGLKEAYEGRPSSLSADQLKKAIEDATVESITKRAGVNAVTEKAYFEANGKKPGIMTTVSGLQYEVIVPSNGPKPAAKDTVVILYQGSLTEGTLFENRTDRKAPVTVPVAKLFPGFAEGVSLMSVGSRVRLFIPSSLAFKAQGRLPTIEPNVPLIYEVELLSVK